MTHLLKNSQYEIYFELGQKKVFATAVNKKLRKGPCGGGRDLDGIVEHVMGADASYLRTLGWKFAEVEGEDRAQNLITTLPVSLTIFSVFLAMKRVKSESTPGQTQFFH